MYRNAGVVPRIVHINTLAEGSGANLVVLGKGIYVIPGRASRRHKFSDGAMAKPLDEPSFGIEVHLAWRKSETSAIVLNFLRTARNFFQIGSTPVQRW